MTRALNFIALCLILALISFVGLGCSYRNLPSQQKPYSELSFGEKTQDFFQGKFCIDTPQDIQAERIRAQKALIGTQRPRSSTAYYNERERSYDTLTSTHDFGHDSVGVGYKSNWDYNERATTYVDGDGKTVEDYRYHFKVGAQISGGVKGDVRSGLAQRNVTVKNTAANKMASRQKDK